MNRIEEVDMNDDDVTIIWDRPGMKFEYVHPITRKGMDIIGLTPESLAKSSLLDLENILRSAKKDFKR
jgi:hypothetical protein